MSEEIDWRDVFKHLPALLWEGRQDGSPRWVNDRVLALTAARHDASGEQGWLDLIAPDDRARVHETWRESARTGEPYETLARVRRPDGGFRWHFFRAIPMRDQSGAIDRWLGVGLDVDAECRAREDLERQVTYEARSMAILNHELRNPLAVINMSAAFALDTADLPPPVRAALQRITSSADRAMRLVDDFMDVARAGDGEFPLKLAIADLREVVRAAIDELRAIYGGHEIAFDAPRADMTTTCDRDRVVQVLGNLVGNAVQHGGLQRPITVRLQSVANALELTVHNGGEPIPAADIPHVFEPLWRGQGSEGLGLGLYIAREIVAAHGGELTVRSVADEGTTFTMRLLQKHTL